MSPDILNSLTPDDLTLYFVGGVLLIGIPPLVGVGAIWILFGQPLEEPAAFWRRLAAVIGLCVLLAAGLGMAGLYLLEPASPPAMWTTLLIALIFGLLGAGKLYWQDDPPST